MFESRCKSDYTGLVKVFSTGIGGILVTMATNNFCGPQESFMMFLPGRVKTGITYEVTNNQLTEAAIDLAPYSKLTLFTEGELDEQQSEFFRLLQAFPQPLYFSLRASGGCFYWDVYATYQPLICWVKNTVAASGFDYLLWPEKTLQPPQLLLFDMDSTFITIEVIDELAKKHQVGEQVARVTEAAMQGELDFAQSLIQRVACLKGLSSAVIGQIAASLPLSQGVADLVAQAAAFNCPVAIVSGGFTPFVEKLKAKMGLFQVHANRLKIVDGALTGEVEGKIVDAKAKADYLLDLCRTLNISATLAMAIGDGANDLLMMKAAGFNLAYRAKPKVQAEATGRIIRTNLGRLAGVFAWEKAD
jgi:phosphoserine phosphatase